MRVETTKLHRGDFEDEYRQIFLYDAADNYVGEVSSLEIGREACEAIANLFVAAPALLTACKCFVGNATPEWCDCDEAGERGTCRHMLAAAAIAESEGSES